MRWRFPRVARAEARNSDARPARPRSRRRLGRSATIAAALTLTAGAFAATGAHADTPQPAPYPIDIGPNFTNLPAPLTTSQCQATYHIRCYTPTQLHAAYGLDSLYRQGIDGRGTTVVVPIPFGSPTIRHDLRVFDKQFGLPHAQVQIVRFGDIPPYDPTDITRVEWAAGTTLVVEGVHAIAPRAKIVIAETAVSLEGGPSGFPELLQAEESLINAGVGDVIAQIEATGEATFPGANTGDYSSLLSLRRAYRTAADHDVTVLAPAGNGGRGASARWPSSDPLVTSVGGSQLYLDDNGQRQRSDPAWNDGYGAGGGGLSAVFNRPFYQAGVADVVGTHRGVPDITMSGSVDGGAWVYASFAGTGGTGWDIFDGSGQAMSMFAGVVALADQVAGRRIGQLNPALYRMGERAAHGAAHTGLVDITEGDTTFNGVPGFAAGPGYDLATGWGTVDAPAFVTALAHAPR